ncbi:hypothetical protein A2U01_0068445, partial [Trifolium medium]|nr:hypothetical protein [Trifolium medium]
MPAVLVVVDPVSFSAPASWSQFRRGSGGFEWFWCCLHGGETRVVMG